MNFSRTDFSIGNWAAALPVVNNGAVLVVAEKDADASRISGLLAQSGYTAQCCSDISSLAVDNMRENTHSDAFVGSVFCHRRATAADLLPKIPGELPGKRIVVITDCNSEQTVVSFLENGAHHVFSMRDSSLVLQVRLEAALRHHSREANRSFSLDDIHFDVQKRRVWRAGQMIELSPKEYELALYLFSNRERVVCNSELMTSIWSLPASMDTRRIDTAACRLRKKMNLNAGSGWELKRLRSIGYRLVRFRMDQAREEKTVYPQLARATAKYLQPS